MPMTKKDYQIIAGVIARYNKQLSVDFVTDLARALLLDNPTFDGAKFFRACYPNVETNRELVIRCASEAEIEP